MRNGNWAKMFRSRVLLILNEFYIKIPDRYNIVYNREIYDNEKLRRSVIFVEKYCLASLKSAGVKYSRYEICRSCGDCSVHEKLPLVFNPRFLNYFYIEFPDRCNIIYKREIYGNQQNVDMNIEDEV